MPDNNTDSEEGSTSPFAARSVFPEPASILTFRPKSLNDIKHNCLFGFDTNVLLLPYTTAPKNLEAIRSVLSHLASEKRIFLPAQVVREFAKHRATKLTEVHKQIVDKIGKIVKWDLGTYTLLESVDAYKDMIELQGKANEHIAAYKKSVEKVLDVVKRWNWDDPVTLLYSEIFTEDTIIDTKMTDDELQKNLQIRNKANIPPGYKDGSKPTNSGGDLSIWYTILEIGKSQKKDMVLVSNDTKADWWHQSGGQNLYPRFELVEEYKRETGGYTFHILKMSNFLDLFGTEASIVNDVRIEEAELYEYPSVSAPLEAFTINFSLMNTIHDWIMRTYPSCRSIKMMGGGNYDLVADFGNRTLSCIVLYFFSELPDFYSLIFPRKLNHGTEDVPNENMLFLVAMDISFYEEHFESLQKQAQLLSVRMSVSVGALKQDDYVQGMYVKKQNF